LAHRLKKAFPALPIILFMDGLYAKELSGNNLYIYGLFAI